MSSGYGGPGALGKLKKEFELLARAKSLGVDDASLALLNARLQVLEAGNRQLSVVPPTGIDNLLINSDLDHSKLSFTGAGANDEAFNWYRGCDTAMPVKSAGTNPLWDTDDGWFDWTTTTATDDLSYNFSKRLIRPGQSLFLMFNARLKDGLSGAGMQLEAGIWDKTAGIDNWVGASLSGGAGSSTISIVKIGPGAAVTNYTYVVVASTDRNEVVVSLPSTVLGAAALNATDYNQISWVLTGGVREYRIYRTGPNPGLVGIVRGGGTSFNDQGILLQANAPIPAPSAVQAKTTIPNFGNGLSANWQTVRLVIRVPRNYNFSLTGSDKQWLRIGLRGTSANAVQVDRFGLALTAGMWAPSPQDRNAVSDVIIQPSGDGEQSGVGVSTDQIYGYFAESYQKIAEARQA